MIVTEPDLHPICPRFEKTFLLLGKRWTGLVIRVLLERRLRYGEIEQAIPGISDRLLTERLKELIQEGIIDRTVIDQMPVRIEYGLTKKGLSLAKALDPLQAWAEDWIE